MTHVDALDAGNITEIGIGVIIALVVIGVLLSLIITAIVGRIIIAVIVIGLGIWVWQQRTAIQDKIDDTIFPYSFDTNSKPGFSSFGCEMPIVFE